MGIDFNEKLQEGIKKIESMVNESYSTDDGILKLEMVRLLRYRDILVKAYGNKKVKEEHVGYVELKGLHEYVKEESYARDKVYAVIKELEFRKDNVDLLSGLGRDYDVLLELYSEIFNHWGSYEELLTVKEDAPKSRAERRELGL